MAAASASDASKTVSASIVSLPAGSKLQRDQQRSSTRPCLQSGDAEAFANGGEMQRVEESARELVVAGDDGAAGVWEAVATTLAQAMPDNAHHSIDSTTVRSHVSAAGAKGDVRTGFWPLAGRVHL